MNRVRHFLATVREVIRFARSAVGPVRPDPGYPEPDLNERVDFERNERRRYRP